MNAKLLNVFKERLDKYLEIRSLWDYCVNKPHEAELIAEKAHSLGVYFKEIHFALLLVFPGCPLRISAEDVTMN